MSDKIRLKKVTTDNWKAEVEIEIRAGQEDLMASSSIRLLRRSLIPTCSRVLPRAVYSGKRVVGFLMYDVQKKRDGSRRATIYRFMIDRKYQDKGYGRAALSRALDEIKAIPRMKTVSIGYMPDNPVAKPFYASFGFVEVGRDEDGEVIAELAL